MEWNKTYLAVDTKSLSSPPCSSNCSRVLASPVDWRPMTTHWNIPQRFQYFWLSIANHIHCDRKNYCNVSKISELKAQVTRSFYFPALVKKKNTFVLLYHNELKNFALYDFFYKTHKTGCIVAELFSFDIHVLVYDKSFFSFSYDPPLNGR